jgi:hypothetical protein
VAAGRDVAVWQLDQVLETTLDGALAGVDVLEVQVAPARL